MVWDKKQEKFLRDAVKKNITDSEIADALKISSDAVYKKRKRLGIKQKPKTVDDIVYDFEVKKSESATKKELNSLKEEIARLRKREDAWLKITNQTIHYIVPPTEAETISATAFICTGDWHVEEEVTAESVNGLNEYNLDIAESRLSHLWNNSVRLLDMAVRDTKLDAVVVTVTGDLFTGNIHPDNIETAQLGIIDAALWAQEKLYAGLLVIHSWCEKHNIPMIVVPKDGNHSRVTEKKRQAAREENSIEWMIYNNLKERLPQMKWVLNKGYHTYIDVYGKKIRVHHGDAVKSAGGVGGVMVGIAKAVDGWDKGIRADLNIQGDKHQQMNAFNSILVGSLIGYNAYALSAKCKYEPPMQKFFLYTNKGVVTSEHVIFLE